MKQQSVELASARLRFETFTLDDVDDVYLGWLNDGTTMRFSNQRFRTHTFDSARRYLESFRGSPNMFLAICLAETRRKIGTMTAYIAEPHGTADMGLLIGERASWGKGYGLEAWTTLMEHLFSSRGIRKVTAGTVRPNVGMRLILERSGMKLEAIRTRQEIVDGLEQDVLLFARFRNS